MYTTDDLVCQEINYEYRRYSTSGISYETQPALLFTTIDGKYKTTHPDADGYSYWTMVREGREDTLIGLIESDYIFGIAEGKLDAVSVLNRLVG